MKSNCCLVQSIDCCLSLQRILWLRRYLYYVQICSAFQYIWRQTSVRPNLCSVTHTFFFFSVLFFSFYFYFSCDSHQLLYSFFIIFSSWHFLNCYYQGVFLRLILTFAFVINGVNGCLWVNLCSIIYFCTNFFLFFFFACVYVADLYLFWI